MHVCGLLSIRIIELFNKISRLPILVLSPCCMPRGKNGKKLSSKVRANKWNHYRYWCLYVYTAIATSICIPPATATALDSESLSALLFSPSVIKDIVYDDEIVSEKNAVILAVKSTRVSPFTFGTSHCGECMSSGVNNIIR